MIIEMHTVQIEGNTRFCCVKRKTNFHDGLLNELISSVKNQQGFWQTMHKISRKRVQPINHIAIDE